jgi:hypothetical protein
MALAAAELAALEAGGVLGPVDAAWLRAGQAAEAAEAAEAFGLAGVFGDDDEARARRCAPAPRLRLLPLGVGVPQQLSSGIRASTHARAILKIRYI